MKAVELRYLLGMMSFPLSCSSAPMWTCWRAKPKREVNVKIVPQHSVRKVHERSKAYLKQKVSEKVWYEADQRGRFTSSVCVSLRWKAEPSSPRSEKEDPQFRRGADQWETHHLGKMPTSLLSGSEGRNGGYIPGYVHGGYVHVFDLTNRAANEELFAELGAQPVFVIKKMRFAPDGSPELNS
ncbi:hypothetical protein B0H19DRAFT_1080358 [Mycena capillaripes]|nr:hypothetical protein B0H19DRAFT_1080358 [Mycena capillaripes]